MYDVIEGREELAEVEMQKTSYQEGDSEEELSTPGHVMNIRRNKTLSLHPIFKESKITAETI